MKKIFYLIILTFMLIPVAVRAEINFEEMHNLISKDSKLEIKSIPIEYYKNSNYYNTCLKEYSTFDDNGKDICLNLIYEKIVISYIYKNYSLGKDVVASAHCNAKNNTCDIFISLSNQFAESNGKSYEINFVGKYDDKIYNIAKNSMNDLKKSYSIDDMGYINQLINYDEIEKYFAIPQSNIEFFKLYPEIKKHIENNTNIKYIPVFGAGGWSPISLGAGGVVIAYYDDIAVGMSDQFNYSTYRIINISDKTENTIEEYINEALKRIKEYINDDSYKISITYDEEETYLNCGDEDCNISGYKTKFYKLTINNKESSLGISPTDEKNIKKLKIESKDYENDINIETESSDVPLDTIVKVEDLTIKYKGFFKAYDINLYSGIKDEYISKVKDGIIVRIPLPDGYDKKKLDIYHIKEDGKKGEKYQAVVEEIDGKKYAVFTTNHFSIYAIEEEAKQKIENPQTFDGIISTIIICFISFIGFCVSIYFLNRKSKLSI